MNDSARLYVQYSDYTGYTHDSVYQKLTKESVFFGKKAAVYVEQFETPEEFLKQMVLDKESRYTTPEEEIRFTKERYDIEKMVSNVWIRYYGAPDYLDMRKYNEGEIWLSDTLDVKWTPVDEFKTINGYKCQKAIRKNKHGVTVNVWFTEEMPISLGPRLLPGPSGLILEFYDPGSKRFIKATEITSTNIPTESFRRWLKGPIVTKKEEKELYEGETQKAQQFLKMLKASNKSNQ